MRTALQTPHPRSSQGPGHLLLLQLEWPWSELAGHVNDPNACHDIFGNPRLPNP